MATIKFENWDGVTAPSVPAGWSVPLGMITTITGETPISSPNMLLYPSGSSGVGIATWNIPDALSGNVVVQGTGSQTIVSHPQRFRVLARGNSSSLVYTSSTFYEGQFGFGGTVKLNAVVGGTVSPLGTVGGVSVNSGVWYQLTLTCNGSAISLQCQRLSDGFWLNSSGNFQSGVATAISVTDSTVTGAGYAGWGADANFESVYGDDWTFSGLSASTEPDGHAVYPNFASDRRLQSSHYGWVDTPQIGDASQPPGNVIFQDRVSWPGLTPAPKRTTCTAYDGIQRGIQQGDLNQPSPQRWPDIAKGLGRAATYDTTNTPSTPDRSEPAMPVWPTAAPGSRRASIDSYGGTFNQLQVPTSGLQGASIYFPSSAPGAQRSTQTAYSVVVNGQADIDNPPAGTPNHPFWAYGPQRSVPTSYQGVYVQGMGAGNITPPPTIVACAAVFPDRARGPARSTADSYDGLISQTALPDNLMPQDNVEWPDQTWKPRWAAVTAYQALTTINTPGGTQAGQQHFPDQAPSARRAPGSTYVVTVSPQIADARMPARPVLPDPIRAAARAATTSYIVSLSGPIQLPIAIAPATSFPDRAAGPRRATPFDYRGLLSAPNPAAGSLAGMSHFPDFASSPRRAGFEAYSVVAHPGLADPKQPVGAQRWPDQAPGPRRTSPSGYLGLISKPAQVDFPGPAGTPNVSLPQRSPARSTADAYKGLIARQGTADQTQPPATPAFPHRADAARRSSASSYEHRVTQSLPQTLKLSLASNVNFQTFCNLGGIHVLMVSANINFTQSTNPPGKRYRWGDTVNFSFTAPAGRIVSPPTLTITQSGVAVASYPLWSWDGGITFQANVVLTQLFSSGRLIGSTVLMTTAGNYGLQQSFDLVDGGDPASTVISIHTHEGVAGRAAIVQLKTGQLVQGSGPWIST